MAEDTESLKLMRTAHILNTGDHRSSVVTGVRHLRQAGAGIAALRRNIHDG